MLIVRGTKYSKHVIFANNQNNDETDPLAIKNAVVIENEAVINTRRGAINIWYATLCYFVPDGFVTTELSLDFLHALSKCFGFDNRDRS